MKRLLPTMFIFLLMSFSTYARNLDLIIGHWQGAFVRENSIQQVEISLSRDPDTLIGKYSIPELGLYEAPIKEVTVSDSSVGFRFLYGPFELKFHTEIGQMTGINERWNPPVSLHLKKIFAPPTSDYLSEELTFYNGEVKLAGTLIKPIGQGPFPAVVLVHGSGEQGRQMWEYRSHGYSLAKRGIAVLLYDKRGVGNSSGNYRTVNFEVLAEDAIAGIKTLKGRDDIMASSVGLFGISQGGWISAIASRKDESSDFVVLLQGPSVSLEEQEFHRVQYSLVADGFSKSSVDSALEHTKNYFRYVNEKNGWDKLEESSKTATNSTWADYVNTATAKDDPNFEWWRTNAYDPEYDLQSIKVPVLAIFGEIDTAVPVKENRPKMEKFLTKADVKFEIAVIPGLHHSATTYQGLHGGDNWDWPNAFWKWSRRPTELDEIISEWVKNQ